MKDINDIEIQEGDFIYIDREETPRVGIVVEDEGELKCVGLYKFNDAVIVDDEFIATLNDYDPEDLEVITREEAKNIVMEDEEE